MKNISNFLVNSYKEDLDKLNLIFQADGKKEYQKKVFLFNSNEILKISDEYKIGKLIVNSRTNPLLILVAFFYAKSLKSKINDADIKIREYISEIDRCNIFDCNVKNHKTYKYGKIFLREDINYLKKFRLIIKEHNSR